MIQSFTRHPLSLPARLASLLLGLSLVACGGGGDSGTTEQQPAAGYALVQGRLTDTSGAALASAQVYMPFGSNQAWGVDTDAQGNFSFQARAADFANVNPVALVIHKAGFRPRTLYFAGIQAGARYEVPTDSSTAAAPLANGEYVPVGLVGLLHVGDDSFDGSVNSQLQTGSRGRMVDFEVLTWTAELKARYSTAVVEFVGRGVQGLVCTTQMGLAAFSPATGVGIPRYMNPGNSDANGGFTRFALRLNVADFPAGPPVRFVAIAGQCANDLDDLEIAEVVVRFEP